MKINYVCKQVTASDKLKALIDRKISKLDKYFKNGATATVTLSKIKEVFAAGCCDDTATKATRPAAAARSGTDWTSTRPTASPCMAAGLT